MKVTVSNARADRSGKHNDRNFNLDYAPHIDQSKQQDNRYWTYNGRYDIPFSELEEEYYRQHFSDHVETQNQKLISYKNPGRVQTIEQYHRKAKSRPEDVILQIGNVLEHASGEELWECAMRYRERFNELWGDHCVILDMALHMDEETPHVHIRRVWIAENDLGQEHVNQTRALEQMGILPPDTGKNSNRYNNSKMTFSEVDRELFRQVCIEKGLDVDEFPRKGKQQHLTVEEYKKTASVLDEEIERSRDYIRELDRKISLREDRIEEQKEEIDSLSYDMLQIILADEELVMKYQDELDELDEKRSLERYRTLLEILKQEAESAIDTMAKYQTR